MLFVAEGIREDREKEVEMTWEEEENCVEEVRRVRRLIIGDSMIKNLKTLSDSKIIVRRGARVGDLGSAIEENMDNLDGIIIHVGTNDVGSQTDLSIFERTFVDLINLLKRRASKGILFLSNILPRPRDGRRHDWGRYNRIISNVARQPRCVYINGCRTFSWPNGAPDKSCFAQDGLHLNSRGTELLSEIITSRSNYKMIGMYKDKFAKYFGH